MFPRDGRIRGNLAAIGILTNGARRMSPLIADVNYRLKRSASRPPKLCPIMKTGTFGYYWVAVK